MRRRRRNQNEGSSVGSPLWMTTFSDMMTLLLCFFVLLFSFSSIDVARFQAVMSFFTGNLGVLDGGRTFKPEESLYSSNGFEMSMEEFELLYHRLSDYVQEENLQQSVHLELDERGMTIRFADNVFFDIGKAELKPEAKRVLDNISPWLKELENPIRIEGHTDNWPINTPQFPSNWELSTHRATNVIRYLVEEQGFNPEILSAAGYGEYRPLVSNDTAENRSKNRRVDIVILRTDLWIEEP
ncbi:MAG: OmpA family protein [Firmicutes bacterium]|nr:OmpA family protein [Bacillota bacterium]